MLFRSLSDNTTNSFGGGILNRNGTVTVQRSTLSGNTADFGGGIDNSNTLTVQNSTLSGNTAHFGGGIDNEGTLTVQNTIVAKNHASRGIDISGGVNAIFSLLGSTSGATLLVGSHNNLLNVDPHLGPLQNNGGPTMTMALLANSAAIDAGDDSVTGPPNGLTADQRGHARKVGKHVDIGAFEFMPPPPPHHRRGRVF